MRFSKGTLHFLFFSFFYAGEMKTEKSKKGKWKRPKNPIKIVFFLRWSSKNVKIPKNGFFFCKNCLTPFVSGRERKRAFSCTLSVLAKRSLLAQKSVNQEKAIKIVVSAEIAQNQK